MTNAEMNRRLATISEDRLVQARRLYREGNGGATIKIETGLTLAQVNAVCQQYDNAPKAGLVGVGPNVH